jgi:hypothetical protein
MEERHGGKEKIDLGIASVPLARLVGKIVAGDTDD